MPSEKSLKVARDVWNAYQTARYGKRTDLIQCIAEALDSARSEGVGMPSEADSFGTMRSELRADKGACRGTWQDAWATCDKFFRSRLKSPQAVSEERLEVAAWKYAPDDDWEPEEMRGYRDAFKAGARWGLEQK